MITEIEQHVLDLITRIAMAIDENDVEEAKRIVVEENGLELNKVQASSLNDILVTDSYARVNDAYMILVNGMNSVQDRPHLIRVAQVRQAFAMPEQDRRAFIAAHLKKEELVTGRSSDFAYVSMMLRLCRATNDFESMMRIRGLVQADKEG